MIVFHLGYQKTGTTLIQNTLGENRDVLLGLGLNYIPRRGIASAGHGITSEIRKKNVSDHDLTRVKSALLGMTMSGFVNVFSDEGLSGSFSHCYRAILNTIKNIDRMELGEVVYLIYVKRQDKFYESMWRENAFQLNFESFSDLRKRVPPQNFDWLRQISQIESECLGRVIVKFGDFIFDERSYVEDFLSAVGVSVAEPLLLPRFTNRSLDDISIEILRRASDLGVEREYAVELRSFLLERSSKLSSKKPMFSEDERLELLEFFSDSNAELVNRYAALDQRDKLLRYYMPQRAGS